MNFKYKDDDLQKVANEIYKKLSESITKVIEENKYLDDEVKIYSTAIALTTISSELLSQTTNLDDFDILSLLTKNLSENLNIDFIIEDEDAEDLSLLDKKVINKKNILN